MTPLRLLSIDRTLGASRLSLTCLVPVLFAVACLALATPAAALDVNGYLPAEGHGDVAFSYTAESWDRFWNGERLVANPDVVPTDINTVTLWARYGITDDLALIVNLPYVDADSDGGANLGESDLQDLSVLLMHRFASVDSGAVRHRWLVGGGIRHPASNYEEDAAVDVGDGTTDLLTRIVYQLEAGRFYASQQVGFDIRGEDAPSGWALYTELGYTTGRLTWIGYYQQQLANGGTDIGEPGSTFPSNEEEFEKVGAKVFGRINDRFGLSLTGFTTLDGRNTAETEGLSLGAVFGF